MSEGGLTGVPKVPIAHTSFHKIYDGKNEAYYQSIFNFFFAEIKDFTR